jgi:peroxiredoxin
MKLRWILLSALCLVAVSFHVPCVGAEELVGSLTVSGSEVVVQVRRLDGRPAAGVPVRLIYARQLTTAAASTDEQGRWIHAVARPGPYEAIVESNADGENFLRLPFIVLESAETGSIPWVTILAGLVCLVGGVVLWFVWRSKAAIVPLLLIGCGLLTWSAWCYWLKPAAPAFASGPDVASSAREFLRSHDVKPLSGPLERLLADDTVPRVKSQPHPLLGKQAPDFELTDSQQKTWRLRDKLNHGPVVLIFYYGYHCNHCVGQLFAVHDDIAKFRELGAEVVAVSADPQEWTRARFKQYGEFSFAVLSDPGNKVAQSYEVFQPASGKTPDDLRHGTFVIGRDGLVHWTQYGYEPFTGNPTLLYELARLEHRLPVGMKN